MSLTERKIKNGIKRILKRFPQYKRIDNIDDADIAIICNTDDVNKFILLSLKPYDKEMLKNNNDERSTIFYLKHKNERNRRQIINNDVGKKHFMLQG